MHRAAVTVAASTAEEARARMLELFPQGFEEVVRDDAVEFAVYVPRDDERRLRAAFGKVRTEPVAADWQERWRSFHRPVVVRPLWVGPPWEAPPGDALAVVIDPGRAFGTGAHPTTRLSLELLLELERGALVDVGCGSGVLAIAAARLGFAPVHAVDLDEAAVAATRENAERNDVAVEARLEDALAGGLPVADAAVANIAFDVVEAVLPRLRVRAAVTSGYLDSQQPAAEGYAHVARRTQDGWAADTYRAK